MRKLPQIDSPQLLEVEALPRHDDGTVRWDEVFHSAGPLRVEVGVGNSPFLIEVNRLEPRFRYLGFEYSTKRVLKFLKKVHRAGMQNIFVLRANAMPLLGEAVRPGSVDRIFVNFPDPWPKRRHGKKRFVTGPNVRIVVLLLRPGGGLSLRTDDPRYAGQMLEILDSCPQLVNLGGAGHFVPEPLYPIPTPYELKFREVGRTIYYLEYRKAGGGDG
jgi:tRNA (guanine-N7-)-methyltransferase